MKKFAGLIMQKKKSSWGHFILTKSAESTSSDARRRAVCEGGGCVLVNNTCNVIKAI